MINQYIKQSNPGKFRRLVAALVLLPLLMLVSCKKNDNPDQFNKSQPSLFNYISADKNLGLYQAALKRAGMFTAETFSDGGPFTVFAPVDSAFRNAGLTLDSINKYDPKALASILKYSLVYGKVSSSTLVGFYAQDMFSQNAANNPNVNKNYYGIFLDGIPLIAGQSADLNDGVLHKLGRMPFPPANNIFDIISKTKDLTMMTAAIKRVGYQSKYMTAFPTGTGNYYTLFAATDDAFKKFGYPDIASVQNADANVLRTLFINFGIEGGARKLTSAFRGGYDIRAQYFFIQTDGFTLISTGNTLPTHIIRSDLLATNGVIHVVDQVIAVVIK